MKSKFMIATLALVSKLMDVPKHLRDCSADIVEFSKFFAEHLVGKGPPKKAVLLPWDFVNAWNDAFEVQRRRHLDNFAGVAIPECLIPIPSLNRIHRMLAMFAEDLCGKEFAEVATLYQEGLPKPTPKQVLEKKLQVIQGVPVPPQMNATKLPESEVKALKEAWAADRLYERSQAPPFPPEPPVVEESAKKPWANDSDRLSDVERIPRPPDNDLRHHGSWDF